MAAGRGSKGARRPSPRTPSAKKPPAKGGAKSGAKHAAKGAAKGTAKGAAKSQRAGRTAPAPAPPAPAGPFRLGAVPGTTPGKWIDIWQERMPSTTLELVPIEVAAQRVALDRDDVDAALVRLPIDREGLHLIPLYDEVPVVVCAADSHLTAVDELTLADLAGEVVIVPQDDVLELGVPDAVAPRFAAPASTEEAIATVAAGVGIVIVPMSLARLHHRKDADYRPLTDGPASTIALAWPAPAAASEPAADAAAPLVDTFVGIVRGRTAHSSRR